jgi:hypothetical protein
LAGFQSQNWPTDSSDEAKFLCAPLLPPAHGRRLTRCLPQARFELIEGWGHDLPAALLPRLAATVQFHSG